MSSGAYSLRLARTLYENVYHAMLYNENQQPIGDLEIIPNIPLDRSQVPEDAPEVPAYLLVIVKDADINKDNLIDFEERAPLPAACAVRNGVFLRPNFCD